MPGAQSIKAFQKHFETDNSLSLRLADPLTRTGVSPRGSILVGPSPLNQFRYQLFSIFKEQSTESIKLLGVLRQTPSLK
jgi:hypothetical protein